MAITSCNIPAINLFLGIDSTFDRKPNLVPSFPQLPSPSYSLPFKIGRATSFNIQNDSKNYSSLLSSINFLLFIVVFFF